MKSKLSLIVTCILLAIAVSGCSKKSTSNANANSNIANTNTTTTTVEDTTIDTTEETAEDSSTTRSTDRTKNTGKNTRADKANANSPTAKRSPEQEPPIKSTEKRIRKQGDRIIRDSGGLINEAERRARGILDGRP